MRYPSQPDDNLKQFATDIQWEYYVACCKHGSAKKTAEAYGKARRTIDKAMTSLQNKAARQGYSPDHDMRHIVPDGYTVKGTSTLYKDGQPALQWVKTNQDHERQVELMRGVVDAMTQEITPIAATPFPLAPLTKDLCNLYTLTDCHIGMLAWDREGGDNWDLKIAERTILGCFQLMMAGAPQTETCIINELGDFEHFDGYDAVTPSSRHQLDSDGRFPKIIEVSIRIRRQLIDMALQKHSHVVCVIAEGNHNIVSSVWMRKMFAALYENEPRVTIIDTELPYYCYQFGKVMLGFHHGHIKKNDALPLLFAAQFPVEWGTSTTRHIHTGHRHHEEVKEHSGATVHQHQTLTAKDAHASRGGYHSERKAMCITYDREYGRCGSNEVTPDMLKPHKVVE